MGSIAASIFAQQSREVISLRSEDRADIDGSRKAVGVLLGYLNALVYHIKTLGNVFVEFLAELGKAHVATMLLEQRNSQLAFELLDGIGKRRLRDKQLFCRPGEMLHLCELSEIP